MIDGKESLTIPDEIVSLVPRKYEKPAPAERIERFEDVQIVVRALDLDRPSQGWWGIVPEVSERRLPLVVDADIPTGAVPVGKYFQADVEVIYKLNKKGERIPKKLALLRKRS